MNFGACVSLYMLCSSVAQQSTLGIILNPFLHRILVTPGLAIIWLDQLTRERRAPPVCALPPWDTDVSLWGGPMLA